jgi:hypothetical protein
MHEAVTEAHTIGDARHSSVAVRSRTTLWYASLVASLVIAPRPMRAQLPPSPLPLSNTEDARTLPKGTVLLRALNAWTRFDQVYDAAADSAHHLHPLGNAFSAESLGARQFSALTAAQSALRTLTQNSSLALNLGQAFATADTRIVTTPLSLSYGLTDRLTLGVVVPIVQTHSTVFVELNPSRLGAGHGANVGPNPAQLNAQAAQVNQQLIDQLGATVQSLNNYITSCNNSGGCQNLPQATSARDKAQQFETAVSLLYGGTSNQGSAFVPLSNSAAQGAVVQQLQNLANDVNNVLGGNTAFGTPTPASAPAALVQLQRLATARTGVAFDSLGSPDRIGIGDVEVAATFKLADGFADTTGGLRLRTTLRGVLRLPTGSPPSGTVPFEVGTGTGQTSADGGAVIDLRLSSRLLATFAAQYTAYFTSANVARMPNSDYALFPLDAPVAGTWREGNAVQLEASPRVRLTDYFLVHGAYAFRHQAASQYTAPDVAGPPVFEATTEQRIGLGFSYSTVARYARGRSSVPFEVFFTHLETIAASGGLTPKYSRDQIEFRIYYRLRRGGR